MEKDTLTRLNKYISHNTNYSRREADKLIEDGKISINGKIVTNLATKVDNLDKVNIGKKEIIVEKNKLITVIVYNKPKGEIVSKKDPQGRKTIFDSLDKKFKHFMPVGRLDYSSEGLLLLTDSVDVLNSLMHSNLERIYKIKVDGYINKKIENAMQQGIELEDASKGAYKDTRIKKMNFSSFIAYNILTNNKNFSKLKVIIDEGKNRELRRFFGFFDLNVLDLKRLEYGGISLNNLPTGKSRYLKRDEYKKLRLFLNEDDNRFS